MYYIVFIDFYLYLVSFLFTKIV